jgi:hypothetical protein
MVEFMQHLRHPLLLLLRPPLPPPLPPPTVKKEKEKGGKGGRKTQTVKLSNTESFSESFCQRV